MSEPFPIVGNIYTGGKHLKMYIFPDGRICIYDVVRANRLLFSREPGMSWQQHVYTGKGEDIARERLLSRDERLFNHALNWFRSERGFHYNADRHNRS